jgi:hypothetical protein
MEIVKGETGSFESVVYSYWSGSASTSTIADVTGATIKCYIKRNINDADGSAVLTLTGSVVLGPSGTIRVPIAAGDTNGLTEIVDRGVDWYAEQVVKMADGTTYIRSGVQPITVLPNVGKTLF